MSYESRVSAALRNPTEQALIALITESIEATDANIKSKEASINALAQFYVDQNQPEKIKTIAMKYILVYIVILRVSTSSQSQEWPRSLKVSLITLPKCPTPKDSKLNSVSIWWIGALRKKELI